jgi:hypothetical protein
MVERHRLSDQQAQIGIREFREYVEPFRVGEVIYNRNPDAVADMFAGAVFQGGFRALEATMMRRPSGS